MFGYRPESLEPVGLELQPLPPDVGAETQTQVLYQSSAFSSLLSHPSGPKSCLTFIEKSIGRPRVPYTSHPLQLPLFLPCLECSEFAHGCDSKVA